MLKIDFKMEAHLLLQQSVQRYPRIHIICNPIYKVFLLPFWLDKVQDPRNIKKISIYLDNARDIWIKKEHLDCILIGVIEKFHIKKLEIKLK